MSIDRIAQALDLSADTVRRSYKKLESIDLVKRRKTNKNDTAIRSTDEWNEWFMADKADLLLQIKTSDTHLSTIQLRDLVKTSKLLPQDSQIATPKTSKLLPNTNIDTNNILTNRKFHKMTDKQKKQWHELLQNYQATTGQEPSAEIKKKKLLRVLGQIK